MKTILANKGILALIGFFILVMFIYNIFLKPDVSPVSSELDASSIGNDLLKMHEDLKKVTFDDAKEAERMFDVLMGDEVAPRRKFIELHALSVKNLDI